MEQKRARPERKRRRGTARLDEEILNECEESFTAAQERVSKASKAYYSDTGLMALLCRHDRVLYLVNVTTPGERQYYVLTLLRKVMQELPDDWTVGLLYDIACQLSRSIDKVRDEDTLECSTLTCSSMASSKNSLIVWCLVYPSSTRTGTTGRASSYSTRASATGLG